MNIELLNEIAEAILDEPTKFRMADWVSYAADAPCGTAACIAGHVTMRIAKIETPKALRHMIYETEDIQPEYTAKNALQIDRDQASRLFYLPEHSVRNRWPDDFADAYYDAETPEARADVAFWRIQHFIATEGME